MYDAKDTEKEVNQRIRKAMQKSKMYKGIPSSKPNSHRDGNINSIMPYDFKKPTSPSLVLVVMVLSGSGWRPSFISIIRINAKKVVRAETARGNASTWRGYCSISP
tara:strand:+ start:104 stop:421 length:318 start_codon:yes stop_codon:yes gene_type:complete